MPRGKDVAEQSRAVWYWWWRHGSASTETSPSMCQRGLPNSNGCKQLSVLRFIFHIRHHSQLLQV